MYTRSVDILDDYSFTNGPEDPRRVGAFPQPQQFQQYLVEASKPLRIVFAYDDDTSKVFVHRVLADCSPGEAALVTQGDWLIRADNLSVPGGKWRGDQLSLLLIALTKSKKSTVTLALQRPASFHGRRPPYIWYGEGKTGELLASCSDDEFEPVHNADASAGRGSGRCLVCSFYNFARGRAISRRRLARPQAWREAHAHCVQQSPLLMFKAPGAEERCGRSACVVEVFRPSDAVAAPPPSSEEQSANIVPFRTGVRLESAKRTGPRTVRAILPWLLLGMGRISEAEINAVATEFGLSSIVEVPMRQNKRGAPSLLQPSRGSDLDQFIDCVAALHRPAISLGLAVCGRFPSPDAAVLMYCSANMGRQAATLLAAYLHWLGRLSFLESVQLAQLSCGEVPDRGLLRKATAKLARESSLRRQSREVVWPYGGEHAMFVAAASHSRLPRAAPARATPAAHNGTQQASWPERPPSSRSAPYVAGNGPHAGPADPSGAEPQAAHEWGALGYAGGSVPMVRQEDGQHALRVQLRPQRRPTRLLYCFKIDGMLHVDPAAPHERAPDGSIMNVLPGAQLRTSRGDELRLARREAVHRVRRFGLREAALAEHASDAVDN